MSMIPLWSGRSPMRSMAYRAGLGFLILGALSLACAPVYAQQPATQFFNQSQIRGLHSGIATGTGIIWDTEFATMVSNAIGNRYNEIAFGFMECFGGGMIDDLLAKNLVFASYAAAASALEPSLSWDVTGVRLNNTPLRSERFESTFNHPYAQANGTHRQMAITGRNNDILGDVNHKGAAYGVTPAQFQTHPQYTSSGPIGDNITLRQNNPLNPTANTKYIALLYGGSTDVNRINVNNVPRTDTREIGNINSLDRVHTALLNKGYAAGEINRIDPGGTAKQLRDAWTAVGAATNASTQIYYWNSWGHGTVKFEWREIVPRFFNGVAVAGNDLTPPREFLERLLETHDFFTADALENPLAFSPDDLPFLEVRSQIPLSSLVVELNGVALTRILGASSSFSSATPTTDLFEDGTVNAYYFALGRSDIEGLLDSAMASSSTSLKLSWATDFSGEPLDPGIFSVNINAGARPNIVGVVPNLRMVASPEPGSLALIVIGFLAILIRRERRAG